MKQVKAESLLVLATILSSATFVLVKASLDDVGPSGFVLLRFGLASAIGLLLWGRLLKHLDSQLLRHSLIISVTFGLGYILQTIGLQDTSATSSAFITGTTAVFVPFVYRIVERRKITLLNWLSTGAVLVGLILFTAPEESGFLIGDILTLGSALSWACYIVALDVYTVHYSDHQEKRNVLVLMQFLVTTAIAGISLFVLHEGDFAVNWTPSLIYALVYCSIAATVVMAWIQTHIQRFTHPVRAGVIYALEPIFAGAIALALFNEEWTVREGAGAIVLLSALIVPDLISLRRSTT